MLFGIYQVERLLGLVTGWCRTEEEALRRRSVRLLLLKLELRMVDRGVELLYRTRPCTSVSTQHSWEGDLPDLVIEGIC